MKDYELKIVEHDGSKDDMSDATYFKIQETMSIEEYERRAKLGLVPDVTYYPMINKDLLK